MDQEALVRARLELEAAIHLAVSDFMKKTSHRPHITCNLIGDPNMSYMRRTADEAAVPLVVIEIRL